MNLQNFEIKRELEEREAEVMTELGNLPDLGILETAASSKRARYSEYVKRDKTKESVKPMELNILKLEAEEAEDKADTVKKQRQDLRNELAGLKEQLANLVFQVTKEEVIELQSKRYAIEEAIKRLRATIQSEEKKNTGLGSESGQSLATLTAKKEALLADIAIGEKVDKKALDHIEKQIIEAEKRHSVLVDSAIETSHVIEGLRTKLAGRENELSLIKKQHLAAFAAFLKQELENAGREYVTLANELSATAMKITAIGKILKECGSPTGVPFYNSWEFSLPKVNFAASNSENRSGFLFQYKYANQDQALQNAKNDLVKIGVDIPQ